MKKLIFFLPIFFFSFQVICQFSPINDLQDFKRKVDKTSSAMNTMSSDFIQEKHLSFMTEPIITKGVFKFSAPNKIRWEYNDPFSYILVINNDQLYINDEGNKNKIDLGSNDMFKQVNKIISDALMGRVLTDDGRFEYNVAEDDQLYKINLQPIEEEIKAYLSEIEVYFQKSNLLVSKVKMYEDGGDFTLIKFTNNQMNTPLGQNIFEIE